MNQEYRDRMRGKTRFRDWLKAADVAAETVRFTLMAMAVGLCVFLVLEVLL